MNFSILKTMLAMLALQQTHKSAASTPITLTSKGALNLTIIDAIAEPVISNYTVNLTKKAAKDAAFTSSTSSLIVQQDNTDFLPTIAYIAPDAHSLIFAFTYDLQPGAVYPDHMTYVEFYTSRSGLSMVRLCLQDQTITQRPVAKIATGVVYSGTYEDDRWHMKAEKASKLVKFTNQPIPSQMVTPAPVLHEISASEFMLHLRNVHTFKHKFPSPKKGANLLSVENQQKIIAIYKSATPSEKELIEYMLGKMTEPEHVVHFFLGGHIELHGDGAESYKQWVERFGAKGSNALKKRISSHVSADPQFALSGPVVSEALFGTRIVQYEKDVNSKIVWLQLESHPVGGLREWTASATEFANQMMNTFLHMVAYFDYIWNKNNVGPWGKSTFVEADPLRIYVGDLTSAEEQHNRALWKETFLTHPGEITHRLEHRMHELTEQHGNKPGLD